MGGFFTKNLQSLYEVNENLASILENVKELKHFELEKNEKGVNFIKNEKEKLYKDPNDELLQSLIFFKKHYEKYPVLYFYGFGNGMLYKALCENDKLKHLIVFEDEPEILALALGLFDFSHELLSAKLIILESTKLNSASLNALFSNESIQKSIRIYNLHPHSDFYKTKLKELNQKIIQAIQYLAFTKGNDPKDSLIGIQNTLCNLKTMLGNGIFKSFLKEQKFKHKNAIIVASGPSLSKQLGLLKKYQNKASIFCLDSAYAVLFKENIKPDYVLSLERIPLTSEFFNNDFKEFDENILFIISSLTHPNTLKYLKKSKRKYLVVMRPFYFESSLNLNDFGYLAAGASVANMAYELAGALRYENIILIGQDLAYDKHGGTHFKDYVNAKAHKDDFTRDFGHFQTLAYGGEGEVQSSLVWTLFRQALQKDIILCKEKLGIKTYNATEGGARIEGAIEKPFKEVCEEILSKKMEKKIRPLHFLNAKEQKEKLRLCFEILEQRRQKAQIFIQESKSVLNALEQATSENLSPLSQRLCVLYEGFKQEKFNTELFTALNFHFECENVKLYATNADIQATIRVQKKYFYQMLELLNAQNEIIENFLKEENEVK